MKRNKEDLTEEISQPTETEETTSETSALETLAEELKKVQESEEDWKEKCLRAHAEMENLKRRTQLDIAKSEKYALGNFASDLLPVADSLERALEAFKKEDCSSLAEGVALTLKELLSVLKKHQIEPIESVGKLFDPNFAKAIQEIDDPTHESGIVVQEIQKGYMIGEDRVLREALVIVSK